MPRPGPDGKEGMPRPREMRRSKLRDRDDETINKIGMWSREKLEQMDRSFRRRDATGDAGDAAGGHTATTGAPGER
jgi:hypothetical protein